ncbi:ParB N-terminal domain-containing protein [Nocardioides vastitatis]|uniref:ParB N-terminal domain-containing protein n=1 Tax=Nocardioides vastitatis TaxID=2568655 RepID=A0ABW0ZQQ9_9ACTN|nr:ParB/RepB/Spo0J family partition protein [Nocardioides sp.]
MKERGVLEAVTVYRNEDGRYVLLRGQRRTVTAAEIGTPTGLIPARVAPQPADADRIGDQMVENIHRSGMREAEIVVDELSPTGVAYRDTGRLAALSHSQPTSSCQSGGPGTPTGCGGGVDQIKDQFRARRWLARARPGQCVPSCGTGPSDGPSACPWASRLSKEPPCPRPGLAFVSCPRHLRSSCWQWG